MTDRLPIDGLRAAYAASSDPDWLILERMGWGRKDGARLQRTLGVRPEASRGHVRYRKSIRPELGARLCRALNRDPFEVGL